MGRSLRSSPSHLPFQTRIPPQLVVGHVDSSPGPPKYPFQIGDAMVPYIYFVDKIRVSFDKLGAERSGASDDTSTGITRLGPRYEPDSSKTLNWGGGQTRQ